MSFNDAGLGQAMGESHNREMALHAQNQARLNEIEIKQLKERVDQLERASLTIAEMLGRVAASMHEINLAMKEEWESTRGLMLADAKSNGTAWRRSSRVAGYQTSKQHA